MFSVLMEMELPAATSLMTAFRLHFYSLWSKGLDYLPVAELLSQLQAAWLSQSTAWYNIKILDMAFTTACPKKNMFI